MADKYFNLLISGYLLVAIFTFGHSFNSTPCREDTGCINRDLGSFMSGVAWPLYWSVELQRAE